MHRAAGRAGHDPDGRVAQDQMPGSSTPSGTCSRSSPGMMLPSQPRVGPGCQGGTTHLAIAIQRGRLTPSTPALRIGHLPGPAAAYADAGHPESGLLSRLLVLKLGAGGDQDDRIAATTQSTTRQNRATIEYWPHSGGAPAKVLGPMACEAEHQQPRRPGDAHPPSTTKTLATPLSTARSAGRLSATAKPM
jgi:hypothetical protein